MARGFEKLLSQGLIGKMKVRNRIVMPPMGRNYATVDGFVTQKLIDHYAARARGGVGLTIVEASFVHPAGRLSYRQIGIHDDRCIPGLSELAEAVKSWGSKVAIQIVHGGRQSMTEVTGMPVVGASAVACPFTGGQPRELTTEEVARLVETFAQAVRRAKQAGFDAVELHAAHGYLISQFLSPKTNLRTDKYGTDLNGRMTFLLEIIQRSRELVGREFPITVRLNVDDLVDGGFEFNECKQVAKRLEAAGVDALHPSIGINETLLNPRRTGVLASMFEPRGHILGYTEQIKRMVSVPVIAVGSITPEMGEELLQKGKADFISIGRGLLADAELPNKLMWGEREDIRPCIRCNEKCSAESLLGMRCTVNAEVGFEGYGIRPVTKPREVLIVGGGPSGMESARVAALRGHNVTLYEKDRELGGHLIEATVPSFKEDLKAYKNWLIRQIQKLGVKVELGKEVTPRVIDEIKPDVLVLASGSTSYRPDIPGIDKPIVTTAIDVLLGKAKPGSKNIVAGGGVVGCEVALFLAQQKKKMILVEMLSDVAIDVLSISGVLKAKLIDNGVEILTDTKITGVTDSGVVAIDRNQNTINVEGDRVILAMGMVPRAELYEDVKSKAGEVYLIGDGTEPRRVGEATREGYLIGSTI